MSCTEHFIFYFCFLRFKTGAAVARLGGSAHDQKVAGANPGSLGLNLAACQSVLEQDTEPQIAPDVQLPSVRALQ